MDGVGDALELSAPAAAERVRKLEEQSVILGFRAIANPEALGLPLLAFVHVTLGARGHRETFLKGVAANTRRWWNATISPATTTIC